MKSIEMFINISRRKIPRQLCIYYLKPNAGGSLLLTFDDAPHPEVTPAVLNLLRDFDAKSIFFIVGKRIQRTPRMLNRLLKEGLWLGNHTYTHPNDRQMGYFEYLEDLRKCEELIVHHTGVRPLFHRPPGGRLTVASLLTPKKCGLVTINWSRSARDWCDRTHIQAISCAEKMIQEVRAFDILAFNDEWMHTTLTLKRLLSGLHDRGFCLKCKIDHIL